MATLEEFLQMLKDVQSSNNDVTSVANQRLLEFESQNLGSFLEYCITVILNEQSPQNYIQYCVILLNRIFTPLASAPLKLIRQSWETGYSVDFRQKFRDAVFFVLLNENENIYNLASLLLARLISVELNDFPLNDIFAAIIATNEYSNNNKIAIINAINELCLNNIIPKEDIIIIHPLLSSVFSLFGEMFCGITSFTPENAIPIVKTMGSLALFDPLLYQDIEIINSIYTTINLVLPICVDNTLFEYFHKLMKNIIIGLYKTEFFESYNWELYFQIAQNSLNSENQFHVMVGLYFFVDILDYECKQKKKCVSSHDFYDKFEKSLKKIDQTLPNIVIPKTNYIFREIGERISSVLFPRLVEIMSTIENNENTKEDMNIAQPYMIATVCIKKLFQLCSGPSLNYIQRFWDENIHCENWIMKHTLTLLISIVTAPIIVENTAMQKIQNGVYEFIKSVFQTLIEILEKYPIPKIIDTVYYTFSVIFQNFGLVMFNNDLYEFLFDSFEYLYSYDPLYSKRISQVLLSMSKYIAKRQDFSEKIMKRFVNLLSSILDAYNTDPDVISDAFNALNSYFKYACPINGIGYVTDYLYSILTQLSIIVQQDQADPCLFIMKQSYISIISSIFSRFQRELFGYAQQTIDSLVNCFMVARSELQEDVIIPIIEIMSVLGPDSINIRNNLSVIINKSLNSNSPALILNTVRVISSYFANVGEQSFTEFYDTVSIINDCIEKSRYTTYYYPHLLYELGNVVLAVHKSVSVDDRDILYNLTKSFIGDLGNLNCREVNDQEHASNILKAVYTCYRAILSCSNPDDAFYTRDVYRSLVEPLRYFFKFKCQKFDSIKPIIEFLNDATEKLTKRSNLFICRPLHKYIIVCGILSKDPTFSKFSIQTLAKVENF